MHTEPFKPRITGIPANVIKLQQRCQENPTSLKLLWVYISELQKLAGFPATGEDDEKLSK